MASIKSLLIVTTSAVMVSAPAAFAADFYVGAAGSINFQTDSDNAGQTGAFTTGNGAPALPFGTAIDDGTAYGWDTDFNTGYGAALEAGFRYDSNLRSGIELVWSRAGVDSHEDVLVGGTNIDGVDAAVLTGSETQLGASVGDIVADGQGRIRSMGVFANAYYDFPTDFAIQPYVGVGIGYMDVDVEYSPSDVGIINDSQGKFAYQAKLGASFPMNTALQLYSEATYRATGDVEVQNDLFPGTLEVENRQILLSFGARVNF